MDDGDDDSERTREKEDLRQERVRGISQDLRVVLRDFIGVVKTLSK